MVESTDIPIDAAAKAIVNLIDRHVVETASDTYFVSPPLQAAIDRDGRFKLPPDQLRSALETIGNSLVAAGPDSPVPMSMVDSGILARLQSKEGLPELFTVFLLPSHLVWLARRRYDERNYPEAIELSRDALSSLNRLSTAGAVEASRILGLAAARKGRKDDFQYALDVLRRLPETPFTRSNANFIRGFNARLEGYLPQAEGFQRAAYRDAPRNFSVVRELAFICLARGNLQDAETYARRALEIAPDNQFILDVLVGSLIQKMKSQGRNAESEIEDLLERLERASPDDRRSFYETRRAEYELARGRAVESSRLIDLALAKTPHLFNVHALRARILMARGNRTAVAEELQKMNYLVRRPTGEGKSNLRALLDIQADYHAMCGDFTAARRVYDYQGVFDEKEKEQAMRRLDSAEGYARLR
jgi:tetratricopeptide (TPR) repeat protein